MVAPLNKHLPEVAGGVEAVTGTSIIDTGLRDVQFFGATLAEEQAATTATVCAELTPASAGQTAKLTLRAYQSDNTTLSVTAANVAWFAVGE